MLYSYIYWLIILASYCNIRCYCFTQKWYWCKTYWTTDAFKENCNECRYVAQNDVQNYIKHTQACLTPRGAENIAINFRASLEIDPSLDSFFFDSDNGFNKLNRSQCLWQVFTKFPFIFPLVNMIYGKDAQAFVSANDGFIDSIDSKEGVK